MSEERVPTVESDALAAGLDSLAEDHELLWNVARRAIENELIEWRDAGLFVLRNNGFVVNYKDGSPSNVIRFGPEVGVRIALRALATALREGHPTSPAVSTS